MIDRIRSVDSDPVELRTQAVILEHSAAVLAMTADSLRTVRTQQQDAELGPVLQRAITVFGASLAGLGDGVGELGAFVRLVADDVDPAGVTGSEDAEATHPRRPGQSPVASPPETAAAELSWLSNVFAEAAAPLTRQRVNLLSAAAALVTQLPAEQLPRFVYLSSSVATRMLRLTEGLEAAGRAMLAHSDRPTAPETQSHAAALSDLLVEETAGWLPAHDAMIDGVAGEQTWARIRSYAARPERKDGNHPRAVTVHDTVVPVELPSDR